MQNFRSTHRDAVLDEVLDLSEFTLFPGITAQQILRRARSEDPLSLDSIRTYREFGQAIMKALEKAQ
ncbi:MAG: hypothetical protein WCT32_00490 [Patescibacteria group bacterium]|jgi:hypothetical protein